MRPSLVVLALACACERPSPAVVAPAPRPGVASPRIELPRPPAIVDPELVDAARSVAAQDRDAVEVDARCSVAIAELALLHVPADGGLAAVLTPSAEPAALPCDGARCRGATVLTGASGPGLSDVGLAVPAPQGGWWVWPQAASEPQQYHCTAARWGALVRDDAIVHARVGVERSVVFGAGPQGEACDVDVDADCMIGCLLAGRDDLELLVDARSGAALMVTRTVQFAAPRSESAVGPRHALQLSIGHGLVDVRGCGTARAVPWPPAPADGPARGSARE